MIRIRLFGRFELRRSDGLRRDIEVQKLQELFSYLLLNAGRTHRRETLADTLWGESSGIQARKYLRQALWQLQDALEGAAEPADSAILICDPEWVGIAPEAGVQVDVIDFLGACAGSENVSGLQLSEGQARELRAAADLYTGDLLESCYGDWCLFERERLQNMYLALLQKLMAYCEAQGACEPGIEYGMRVLRIDRAREQAHRALMRLYYLAGDRTAALRQYNRCAGALREELDVAPGAQTVALYELIRADRLGPTGPTEVAGRDGAIDLVGVLHRLHELHAVLADADLSLQREIRTVESVLRRSP
jgi:DNA-binding SARP family transcriptional activator